MSQTRARVSRHVTRHTSHSRKSSAKCSAVQPNSRFYSIVHEQRDISSAINTMHYNSAPPHHPLTITSPTFWYLQVVSLLLSAWSGDREAAWRDLTPRSRTGRIITCGYVIIIIVRLLFFNFERMMGIVAGNIDVYRRQSRITLFY